jgi:hypothetical protein
MNNTDAEVIDDAQAASETLLRHMEEAGAWTMRVVGVGDDGQPEWIVVAVRGRHAAALNAALERIEEAGQ